MTADGETGAPAVGVVLAAGESSRFDRDAKLLLPWGRHTVVAASVDAALAAGLQPVLVVVGHRGEEVRRALEGRPVRVVENPRWSRGQSGSLGRGIAGARRHTRAPAAAVLLGDEPGISPEAIRTVVDAWRVSEAAVVRAVYEDRPGHPVVFDRSVFRAVEALEGDEGARAWIAGAGAAAEEVALDRVAPVDLDTPAAYRAALDARPPGDASGARPRGEA